MIYYQGLLHQKIINRNVRLLDNEAEFIEKTKKNGWKAYLLLQCLICLDIVKKTSIDNFVNNNHFGCSCNTNFKYSERYSEIKDICKEKNIILLDTETEYIEKTKKMYGKLI